MRFYRAAFWACLVFVFISAFFLIDRNFRTDARSLPVYGIVNDFELLNQNGAVVTNRELRGAVNVVNFIFTSCTGICPTLTNQMAKLEQRTRLLGNQVRFLSISVDPITDVPERLLAYGLSHRVNFNRWSFLTGPLPSIQKLVMENFKTAMQGETWEGITHGETFVVVDQAGKIRAFKHATEESDLVSMIRIVTELSRT